jgi:hypothetical protein
MWDIVSRHGGLMGLYSTSSYGQLTGSSFQLAGWTGLWTDNPVKQYYVKRLITVPQKIALN